MFPILSALSGVLPVCRVLCAVFRVLYLRSLVAKVLETAGALQYHRAQGEKVATAAVA